VAHLPRSLIHFSFRNRSKPAVFCDCFSAPDDGDWPSGLTSLHFDALGEMPPLPSTLKVLDVGSLDLSDVSLPDTLTTLRATHPDAAHLLDRLPSELTTLEIQLSPDAEAEHLAHLPASLTHLTLHGPQPSTHLSFHTDFCLQLPAFLRYLRLVSVPFQPFRNLPSSLEHLLIEIAGGGGVRDPLSWGLDKPIRHAALQTLVLPSGFNHILDTKHLSNLRLLSVGVGFDPCLADLTLTDFTFVWAWGSPRLKRLPRSLKKMKLEGPKPLSLDKLPAGLSS